MNNVMNISLVIEDKIVMLKNTNEFENVTKVQRQARFKYVNKKGTNVEKILPEIPEGMRLCINFGMFPNKVYMRKILLMRLRNKSFVQRDP